MKRFLPVALMIASAAAWIAWYRLPRRDALLWIGLLWMLILACHCMARWRTSWPHSVTFLMAFLSVAIAFAIFLGLHLPHSAMMFHDLWIPAAAIAFFTAVRAP